MDKKFVQTSDFGQKAPATYVNEDAILTFKKPSRTALHTAQG